MSDNKEKNHAIRRTKKEFDAPEFNPSIPSHLIEDCDDHDKFILERISVLIQQQRWQMEHMSDVHDYCRNINGKVLELEGFRTDQNLEKAKREGSKLWKRYCIGLLLLVAYPVYIGVADKVGLGKLITIFSP